MPNFTYIFTFHNEILKIPSYSLNLILNMKSSAIVCNSNKNVSKAKVSSKEYLKDQKATLIRKNNHISFQHLIKVYS